MCKTLVIIPAYNEEENIEKVVNYIAENFPQYDCLVINDGSTDRTEELCETNGYAVLNLSINLGIGGAVQAGYLYAKKNHYDIAIQIDGDGQHNPKHIADMVNLITTKGYNMIIRFKIYRKNKLQTNIF